MPDSRVANRYAEAMIDVAAEQDAVEAVGHDLRAFTELLQANERQLYGALCTPVFSETERTNVLEALVPKLGVQALSGNFLRLINAKGRMSIFSDIATAYTRLADKRAGRIAVQVTTAEPMSDAIAAEVKAALAKSTGKEIILHADVDPELLGGMVARVGGKLYDSSIRTRLQAMGRALIHAQPVGEA
jgi:F-type H+-transporting ATPase subunit delta